MYNDLFIDLLTTKMTKSETVVEFSTNMAEKKEKKEKLNMDEMLQCVGEFQMYQKLICFITSLVTFAISMQLMVIYFGSLPVSMEP